MTTGAPRTAVTEPMLSSVGANSVRAMRSHSRQKQAPPRNAAGIITRGFAVPSILFTTCGTAIPTKDTGPANAVTQAESRLDSSITASLNHRIFTPELRAYASPS